MSSNIFGERENESIYISSEGLQQTLKNYKPRY